MRLAVPILALLASAAQAAPVPRDPLPDPTGRGYLGIYFGSDQLSVGRVEAGKPAAKAGLQPGDVFVRVGPIEPKEQSEMQQFLVGLRPGSVILITVRRGETTKTVTLRLGTRPADSDYIPPVRQIDPP